MRFAQNLICVWLRSRDFGHGVLDFQQAYLLVIHLINRFNSKQTSNMTIVFVSDLLIINCQRLRLIELWQHDKINSSQELYLPKLCK
jgi:hypothetical protein